MALVAILAGLVGTTLAATGGGGVAGAAASRGAGGGVAGAAASRGAGDSARRAVLRDSKPAPPSAAPICGAMSPSGVTTVTVQSLGVSFVLRNFWVCIPGSGPLPADVALLERVDPDIANIVVPELRKALVGAFYLLPGAKIPCLLAVDATGNGPLPTPSAWQQEIADEGKIDGTTVTGLHVTSLAVPAGTILEADFSQTEPGGAVIFVDEFLGDVSSRLLDAAFQGSPSGTVLAQAKQVMETLRSLK